MEATGCRSLIKPLQFQNKNPIQNSSSTINLPIRCRRIPHRPRPCNSSGPLTSAALTTLGSRLRVAYQGVRVAYSESAAEKAYPNCEAVPCEQFDIPFEVQAGTTNRWLIRTSRPTIGAIRKAQVVDYYVQVLMRVLGNERDAQMCMYHVSWQSNYGFCCELDDKCAQELAGMPGILSIQPDDNFGSDDKEYGVESRAIKDSSASTLTGNIKTKKLFVTGLSFYTSEKTLSAAFEGFGELVEVKVIMDKISKRSKGYAFVEYTTEEAASTALREMNGKIINGWMITVDVAKRNPPKYGTRLPRPMS